MVSSRTASIGNPVEFKIADNTVTAAHSFRQGGFAWGVVTDIQQYTPAGDVLTIQPGRIQAENGSKNISWQSHEIVEEAAQGKTVTYYRTHSIYRIGKLVDVALKSESN